MTAPTSPQAAGTKRAYRADETLSESDGRSEHDRETPSTQQTPSTIIVSTFRNVSACNRCRVRKNKCDQRLPACTACEKVNTRCVGFDPITKKEIPRSYLYFLETRMLYLESLLIGNNISFEPADAYEGGSIAGRDARLSQSIVAGLRQEGEATPANSPHALQNDEEKGDQEDEKINKIVSDIGMVSVHGASDRRYLGSTSGISFARVVLAAIKSSAPTTTGDKSSRKQSRVISTTAAGSGDSMRDSYFGLSNKPNMTKAPFPDRDLGLRLVMLYFEHANPQIPILHRVDFMNLFERAYEIGHLECTSQEQYLLYIVFAIGAGVIFGSSDPNSAQDERDGAPAKRARLSGMQAEPEQYHASAIVHLNSFFTSSVTIERSEGLGGDLEDLQAILLLASFALLRPVAPGLWYIVGVAMRLAVDLGLHFEDGLNVDGSASHATDASSTKTKRRLDPDERGRREWTRDMRRRLWWCTYCFDRLVSTCVGRPFGITDTVVTTEFPSLLDDKYITRTGFSQSLSTDEPTYKLVAYHYLRLRLLQSEILQVLQHQQAQHARDQGALQANYFVHKNNESPFLIKHRNFRSWRSDVDQRLWEWKESAPTKAETGVAFSPQFLELNYWQAVIMLYRNSLSVPEPLVGELSPTEEVSTPTSPVPEEKDDQDLVFLKCAEAGQKTLKLYRQLHRRRLVNYTYLATHHLFMAGISFLYAVWHSPAVRSNLTIDDFDFTVLAATSVLGDLMEKCPPAKACQEAFDRMSKATVQMCMNTPGFKLGRSSDRGSTSSPIAPVMPDPMFVDPPQPQMRSGKRRQAKRRPPPQFDMDLRDLFPEEVDVGRRPSVVLSQDFSLFPNNSALQQQFAVQQQQPSYHQFQDRSPMVGMQNIDNRRDATNTSPPPSFPSHRRVQMPSVGNVSNLSRSNNASAPYYNMTQNSYNPDFMSNMPGMEFLNQLGSGNTVAGNTPMNTGQMLPGMQPQASSHGPLGSSSGSMHAHSPRMTFNLENMNDSPSDIRFSGLDYISNPDSVSGTTFDFGVGMGLDFNPQSSWGEPQPAFDLDGFFFGGGMTSTGDNIPAHLTNTINNNDDDNNNDQNSTS